MTVICAAGALVTGVVLLLMGGEVLPVLVATAIAAIINFVLSMTALLFCIPSFSTPHTQSWRG